MSANTVEVNRDGWNRYLTELEQELSWSAQERALNTAPFAAPAHLGQMPEEFLDRATRIMNMNLQLALDLSVEKANIQEQIDAIRKVPIAQKSSVYLDTIG